MSPCQLRSPYLAHVLFTDKLRTSRVAQASRAAVYPGDLAPHDSTGNSEVYRFVTLRDVDDRRDIPAHEGEAPRAHDLRPRNAGAKYEQEGRGEPQAGAPGSGAPGEA